MKVINSTIKTLNILECFSYDVKELTLTEISKLLGMPKSNTSNYLYTLVKTGYLEQNSENLKYRLGPKVFKLGKISERHLDIVQIAKPELKILRDKFNETFRLAILNGLEGLCVAEEESTNSIRVYTKVSEGKKIPLHCSASGKLILANLPDDELEKTLENMELPKYTEYTITDKDVLRKVLKDIKIKGYSIASEEGELDLMGIAVPIYNHQMKFIASIGTGAPVNRVSEKLIENITQELLKAAKIISSKL